MQHAECVDITLLLSFETDRTLRLWRDDVHDVTYMYSRSTNFHVNSKVWSSYCAFEVGLSCWQYRPRDARRYEIATGPHMACWMDRCIMTSSVLPECTQKGRDLKSPTRLALKEDALKWTRDLIMLQGHADASSDNDVGSELYRTWWCNTQLRGVAAMRTQIRANYAVE